MTHRFTRVLADQRTGLVLLVIALVVVFGTVRPEFLDEQFVVFPLLRDIATLTVVGPRHGLLTAGFAESHQVHVVSLRNRNTSDV
ncbi:hypothetical protein ACFQ1S_32945 [Kibdelosporangium lantanae]|uniref:Uncharacterized protein n=1 Tax=Kibdelosporangium lantanae TaxID=1497396 RepID=A0ABW3MH30_9PSEU